jgi:hypothetical protein
LLMLKTSHRRAAIAILATNSSFSELMVYDCKINVKFGSTACQYLSIGNVRARRDRSPTVDAKLWPKLIS